MKQASYIKSRQTCNVNVIVEPTTKLEVFKVGFIWATLIWAHLDYYHWDHIGYRHWEHMDYPHWAHLEPTLAAVAQAHGSMLTCLQSCLFSAGFETCTFSFL